MDSRESLSVTFECDHPDGILQAIQLFRSRRTGDLVISANEGVVFAHDAQSVHGVTHGSLRTEHIKVPFATSVSGCTNFMRTSDVFALTLALLGIDSAHALDGSVPCGMDMEAMRVAGTEN